MFSAALRLATAFIEISNPDEIDKIREKLNVTLTLLNHQNKVLLSFLRFSDAFKEFKKTLNGVENNSDKKVILDFIRIGVLGQLLSVELDQGLSTIRE